jgi:hypothetical protein
MAKQRNRGKKKPTLQDLTRDQITEADLPHILQEVVEGTDRSAALVLCSIVEVTLIAAITTRMQEMDSSEFDKLFFGADAPLSTLSAKIRVGKAIGLYQSKLESALRKIKNIRNAFAHSAKPLPFAHPLIGKELAEIPQVDLIPEWFAARGLTTQKMSSERAKYFGLCMDAVQVLEHVAELNRGKEIATGWLDQIPAAP